MQTDHIRDQGLENVELSLSLLFTFLCFIVLSLLTTFFPCFPVFMVEFDSSPEYLRVLQFAGKD